MREHMSCNELITSSIFIGMFSSNFVFSVEPLSTHALSTETLVKLRTMGEHSTTDPEGVPLVFLPLPVSGDTASTLQRGGSVLFHWSSSSASGAVFNTSP